MIIQSAMRIFPTSEDVQAFTRITLSAFPFRYFAVSELGSKRGPSTFHVLFLLDKQSFPTYNDLITQEKLMFDTTGPVIGSKRNPV